MRARVVRALRPLGAFAVENPLLPGTPDVAHALGWVELKATAAWPANAVTNLAVPHFTQHQRLWHVSWRDSGGASLVVLRVGRADWLAFDGVTAAAMLGRARRSELADAAYAGWWGVAPKDEEIERCVREHAYLGCWGQKQRAAAQREPVPPA